MNLSVDLSFCLLDYRRSLPVVPSMFSENEIEYSTTKKGRGELSLDLLFSFLMVGELIITCAAVLRYPDFIQFEPHCLSFFTAGGVFIPPVGRVVEGGAQARC